MDEHAEPRYDEEERESEQSDRERRFTQRELVRASLLRCPPPDPAEAAEPPRG